MGGEGAAYHDQEPANLGGYYRNEGVDIEPTGDAGGGYNVGYMQPGEWLEYTFYVPTAGSYVITPRVASQVSGGAFHVELDGAAVGGPTAFPNTGAWQSYQDVPLAPVSLAAGSHILRFAIDAAGPGGYAGNLNYISISSTAQPPPPDTQPPSPPTGLSQAAVTADSATMNWSPSTDNVGVTGYTIYRGSAVAGAVSAATTTFTDTGLAAGTAYSYTVVARDAAGNASAASAPLAVVTTPAPDTQPPSAPAPVDRRRHKHNGFACMGRVNGQRRRHGVHDPARRGSPGHGGPLGHHGHGQPADARHGLHLYRDRAGRGR